MSEDKKIQQLIEEMGEMKTNAAAADELLKIGKPAVPSLIKALKNKNKYIRHCAAWLLGRSGDSSSVPALIDTYNTDILQVKEVILVSLSQIGDASALSALIKIMKNDGEPDLRKKAASSIGDLRDASTIPALIEMLDDEYIHVRLTAAISLGKIGEPAFESVNKGYLEGRIPYECAEEFYMSLGEGLGLEFDKGCISPAKKPPKNPDEMKRLLLKRLQRKERRGNIQAKYKRGH